MKPNMGTADRVIRAILGIALLILYYFDFVTGTVGIVSIIVAAVFLVTSILSFCPLYAPFGISTCKTEPDVE